MIRVVFFAIFNCPAFGVYQNVASISAGNSEEIGEMVADALDKVGADGVLSIETSNSLETTVDVQEGMEIDRGYISPQFITNQERMCVEFDNARVLITDQKVGHIFQLLLILCMEFSFRREHPQPQPQPQPQKQPQKQYQHLK